jgi:hypothetical protein
MKKFQDDSMPLLLGIPCDYQFAVWCPYCRRMHYHGKVEGHRVAHCEAGPFYQRGYYILDGTKELKKALKGVQL